MENLPGMGNKFRPGQKSLAEVKSLGDSAKDPLPPLRYNTLVLSPAFWAQEGYVFESNVKSKTDSVDNKSPRFHPQNYQSIS